MRTENEAAHVKMFAHRIEHLYDGSSLCELLPPLLVRNGRKVVQAHY